MIYTVDSTSTLMGRIDCEDLDGRSRLLMTVQVQASKIKNGMQRYSLLNDFVITLSKYGVPLVLNV
jgi:hypothetical protein